MRVQELTSVGLGGQLVAEGAVDPSNWNPEWLRALLHKHGVLLLRGTALDEQGFISLGRLVGELEEVCPEKDRVPGYTQMRLQSNVPGLGLRADLAGGFWHSDGSCSGQPPGATLLHGVEVPAKGGETMFADMRAAWRSLPAEDRARVANLHGWWPCRQLYALGMRQLGGGSREVLDQMVDVVHPLVRRTATGEEALHLNELWMVQVKELDCEASKELLRSLFAHATCGTYTYIHSWRDNDVLIWDNAVVMHRGQPAAKGCRKITHRLTARYLSVW
jgi:alpha-ketoglutarate-dependent taurine dioxygenase